MLQQLLAAIRRRRRATEATADDNEALPATGTPTPTYQTFDLLYPRPFSSSEEQDRLELNEAESLLVALMLDD